jgi:hypothetical protein
MRASSLKRQPIRNKAVMAAVTHITEKQFQAQVEDLAHMLGYAASHAHLPYFDTAGMPDLLLVHKETGRTIFAELKVTSKTGRVPKPGPAQQRWLNWLSKRNEVYVWTWPQDWDAIERVLKFEYRPG